MQPVYYQYDFATLSPEQRLQLAEDLIASVRSENALGAFSASEIDVMEQEMAAIRRGESPTVSWSTLRQRLMPQ